LDKAIELKPDYVDAHKNRGSAFAMMQRFDESFAAYDKLFRLDPNLTGVEGHRLNAKMQLCDWINIENETARLIRSVRSGFATTQPFFFLPFHQLLRTNCNAADRGSRLIFLHPQNKSGGTKLTVAPGFVSPTYLPTFVIIRRHT
jgi:tetratricopeptide (TPR) repeat protein